MNLPKSDGRDMDNTPFSALPNDIAPLFFADVYNNIDKQLGTIRLEDYRGKWVILFFYPSNFTMV